ncbi:YopX family protein [Lactiplantibacillus plantarum]|uniref:YopX family protein n=1 Tax=Lactiplantibacillus plantarum TaxID=1590 RepID=UPI001F48076B|nr:YopX family protein [Lactiplantibacillus plantarum]
MIKFRAWNGYRKIMADYVSAIQNGDTQGTPSSVNVIVDGKNETWDIKNDDVELLQFTGLTDVNGNEIYDGDLVRLTDDLEDPIYKVTFDEAKFEISGGGVCYDLNEEFMNCEVIGNVHTNPELLEEDND